MKSKGLFYLSVMGFILTLVIHILALAFSYDVATTYKYFYQTILFCSFIAFGLPLIALSLKGDLKSRGGFNIMLYPITFLQIIYKNAPAWLIALNIACLAYMVLNSIINPNGLDYSIDNNANGLNHAASLISEKEYIIYRAGITRNTTCGILTFYCIGAAMVYPFDKNRKALPNMIYTNKQN